MTGCTVTKVAQVMQGETMHADEIEEERERERENERPVSQLHLMNGGAEWSTDFASLQLASKYT